MSSDPEAPKLELSLEDEALAMEMPSGVLHSPHRNRMLNRVVESPSSPRQQHLADELKQMRQQQLMMESIERVLERQHANLIDTFESKLTVFREDMLGAWSSATLDENVASRGKNSALRFPPVVPQTSYRDQESPGETLSTSGDEPNSKVSTSASSDKNVAIDPSTEEQVGRTSQRPKRSSVMNVRSYVAGRKSWSKRDIEEMIGPCGSLETRIAESGDDELQVHIPTPPRCPLLSKCVHSIAFDVTVGLLVFLNVLVMFADLEISGREVGEKLNLLPHSKLWSHTGGLIEYLEHAFNVCFILELVLRFLADGCKCFHSFWNIFDTGIVVISCIDAYVLRLLMSSKDGAGNLNFARMARLLKLLKFLRAFRVAALFSEMRVLIKTLISSVMALVWSAVLLGFIMIAAGILMAQLTSGFIEDDGADFDLRVWTFKHYGTGLRSTYTIFEATMSGGWPNYARPLIEDVSSWFSLFWVVYVLLVVFAVIRVITALFLQKTMEAAKGDEDMMMMQKMKAKEAHARKVLKFLAESDQDGDGQMDRDELNKFLHHPNFQRSLHGLGLEEHEVVGIFNVLDDGDGVVDHEEFMAGCMRLTGGARAIDSVLIMHEQNKIAHKVNKISAHIGVGVAAT